MKHHPDYNSSAEIKAYLETNGMAMQKKFGQNFLLNETARIKLIDALDISDTSSVWEVGPGLGCMTAEILKRGAKLTAFEIDHGFASSIRDFFEKESQEQRFSVVEGDVLKTWKKECDTHGVPQRFFGNLPYNIAATIIGSTIENGILFDKAVVTVQKEVAQRMYAPSGSDDYSSFSVLCQWAYTIKPLMTLTGGNFWPKPNVDSMAVVLTKREDFPRCKNPLLFCKIQRSLFASRRKTVKNNLTTYFSDSELAQTVLQKAGIDPLVRGEKLAIEDLLRLSDVVDASILERKEK
ncbi:MAG: 16S rRNA (adenine(1518)-N(6)/adenine(1519)-N(6))-dimethyltransferase RsmA [Treponema sp.]|nr:16S rRNA (adenine(1518)-N(6)/adenine(1519)-N(6))-dimethyltransferase RsmA [Treponema sp.]